DRLVWGAVPFEHSVVGNGVPAQSLAGDHDLSAVGAAAGERRCDRCALAFRHAPDKRQVAALELAIRTVCGELTGEPGIRRIGLGHDEQSGRVFVETMHDARASDATDA